MTDEIENDNGHERAEPSKEHLLDLTRLRAEYLGKKLDHTITHTQTASKLFYMVDGAVLALVYFVIGKLGGTRTAVLISCLPIMTLLILNILHSEFVRLQGHWYRATDDRLRTRLGELEIEEPEESKLKFSSAHGVFRAIHLVIAGALFIICGAMIAYGLGVFQEIQWGGHRICAPR